jgi:hypothetical protein
MAIFSVIDTTDGGDTGYEGFVKDAANWSIAETALSGAATEILVGGGEGSVPVFTAATGTGAPVRANTPTLITPIIGAATGTSVNLTGSVTTDTIAEKTPAAGVTIDGVKLKDGGASVFTGGTNTFNITNGTAVLDVAAACTVNVDDNVTFTKGLTVTTNAGTIAFSASSKTLTIGDNVTLSATPVLVGLHTMWIPAVAMVSRTTTGPAVGTAEMTTYKNMFKTLDFDTSADEHAQFCIQMPKSWNEGTVTVAPVWSHGSTTTNFGVAWFVQGVALSNDDAGDVAFGTAVSSVDTGGTTNDIYVGPTTSAMTIAGTPAANDLIMFQIYRDVSDGGDTLGIDARLHGVQLFYTIDAGTDA